MAAPAPQSPVSIPPSRRLRRTLSPHPRRSSGWDWLALLTAIPALGAVLLLDGDGGSGDGGSGGSGGSGGASGGDIKAILDTLARTHADAASSLRREIDDLRRENGDLRTRSRDAAAKWNKLAESIGLAKDSTPEAVEKAVSDKVAEATTTVRTTKVERAIEKAAAEHKADAALVAALVAYDKVTDGVADDKLDETLGAKVKEYVEKRPNLKLAPATPGRSGPEIPPGDPNQPPARKGLAGALDARMRANA